MPRLADHPLGGHEVGVAQHGRVAAFGQQGRFIEEADGFPAFAQKLPETFHIVRARKAAGQPDHCNRIAPFAAATAGTDGRVPQRRRTRRSHCAALAGQAACQRGNGGMLEQRNHRQFNAESLAQAALQPHHQQRVAADVEKVVVHADLLDMQQGAPDRGQPLLGLAARWHGCSGRRGRGGTRWRQRLAVYLAVGCQRQRRQHHPGGRHHEGRQQPRRSGAQALFGRRSTGLRHQVGDQALVARPVLAHLRHSLRHAGLAGDHSLDLTEFDAVAAQLDLGISAAQVFQPAVGPPARQVAGVVHAGTRMADGPVAKRVDHEALGGQRLAAPVAARNAGTTDEQPTRHPHRHWRTRRVQQIDPGVGNRPADRHRAAAGQHALGGGPYGGLGGAVQVPQRAAPGKQRIGQVTWQGLAAAQQRQARSSRPARGQQKAPGGGSRLHHRGARGFDQPGQRRPVLCNVTTGQLDPRAHQQRQVKLEAGDVERQGGDGQQHILCAKAGRQRHGMQEAGQGAVMHHHALGLAGGARGVEQVGEVIRRRPAGQRLCVPGGDGSRVAVHADDLGNAGIQAAAQRIFGQQQCGATVLQHEGQPAGRVGRVQRQVGGAGLHHRQHRHQHGRSALQVDADTRRRPGGCAQLPPQVQCQPVRLRVQLAVAERAALEGQRHGPALPRRLLLQPARDGRLVEGLGGVVPPLQQLIAPLVAQQVKRTRGHRRIGQHRLGDAAVLCGQTRDAGALEQVGAVVEAQHEGSAGVEHVQRQVHLYAAGQCLVGTVASIGSPPGGGRGIG